jgi:hypothetical protein
MLVPDLEMSSAGAEKISFYDGSCCYAALARDSSVVNTLPVLSYWSVRIKKMEDQSRMMMGRLPQPDVGADSRRRGQNAGDQRSVQRDNNPERPEEARRGVDGIDLEAAMASI